MEQTHPSQEAQKLRDAGAQLANIAFNLRQRVGHVISTHDAEVLERCQKAWDAACSTPPVNQQLTAQAARLSAPQAMGWLPIEEATTEDKSGLVWLLVEGKPVLGYFVDIPFAEYRDADGFYTGQQDAEQYWGALEDGEPLDAARFHRLVPPATPTQQGDSNG